MKFLRLAVMSISVLGLVSCANMGHGKKHCAGKKSCEIKAKKSCCKKKDQAKKDCKGESCKLKNKKADS